MLEKKLVNASNNLDGYYSTFNNCREQGLMLTIHDKNTNDELLIWACECRNCDSIMVITGDSTCSDSNDLFNEIAYKYAMYFEVDDYDTAINYTYNIIKKQFHQNFLEEYNTSFKMHKCLADIQSFSINSNELSNNDFYELATFEDVSQLYVCDFIINNGKLGLRYSMYKSQHYNELENLYFEEWEPDLTSSTTLMLGMQNKLNNFIEQNLSYDAKANIGI